jgi:type VI secretion system secreted protein Hcp
MSNITINRSAKILICILFIAALPSIAFGAQSIFVHVDGIPGESIDARHKDWIDVSEYSNSQVNAGSSSTGGAAGGRAQFSPMKIIKSIDRASPQLQSFAASGQHIAQVKIEVVSTNSSTPIETIDLDDVRITEIASTLQNNKAEEAVKFIFNRICWTYNQQKRSDGSGGGSQRACWDLLNNKKF